MTTILEADRLSVSFAGERGRIQAVEELSFSIAESEVLALVGESGCGKSVTALSILGLLTSSATTSGSVTLGDVDLFSLPPREIADIRGKQVSMIFQEPMTSLNPVLTVTRQISEVLRRHEGLSRAGARTRAVELLELVGIPDAGQRGEEYPHQMSGGMRQRVMIAMAIACSPELILADEPTTALDVTVQASVLDTLRGLRDRLGTSILLITHDLGVVADIADRVIVMYAGRQVEEAPVEQLFDRPQHPYTNGLLGAVPDPDQEVRSGEAERRLREIPGRVPVRLGPATSCVFADRCPRVTGECRSSMPPLTSVGNGHRVACFRPGTDVFEEGR
ncbi:ABC transporter ATP-binding protein [Nonomuraea sp. K274]|uniref:ABC transporter ATP-binding protein n=1 Tax=Nonomuraea cypriaca TaxID=1187855 RepID=A0A931AFF9_9ACTN|nr:ABC transporter ATP-binding protein [Nonomuraea cypriaca]MBF8190635.1 ABC transporter ATP-binding protein [Nonomuraea cypriaca]